MLGVIFKYEDDTVKLFDLSKGRPHGVKINGNMRPYEGFVFEFGESNLVPDDKLMVYVNIQKKIDKDGFLVLEDGLEEKFAAME